MLIVDVIIVALLVGAAAWGYTQGVSGYAIALIGFGLGALLGSRIAPLILDTGYKDPFAPIVALPGALICGAVVGALFERFGLTFQRRIRRWGTAQRVAGAALAACLGLLAIWMLAALAGRVDSLRPDVKDSRIVERLNAVLPPPGPLLHPEESHVDDALRVVTGPSPNLGPVDPTINRDPRVRGAFASTVKILGIGCGRGQVGTGWVAGDGIVVTNAHVVKAMDELRVQVRGKGGLNVGNVIWWDNRNDVAVIRAPGVSGVPALPVGPDPKPNGYVAVIGYPGGGPLRVHAARTGATTFNKGLRIEGERVETKITPLRVSGIKPGSSGSAIVDRRGRIRTMAFAAGENAIQVWGVPIAAIRRALHRAKDPVAHGGCDD